MPKARISPPDRHSSSLLQNSLSGHEYPGGEAKRRALGFRVELDLGADPATIGTGEGVIDSRSCLVVDIAGIEVRLLETTLNIIEATKVALDNRISERATKTSILNFLSHALSLGLADTLGTEANSAKGGNAEDSGLAVVLMKLLEPLGLGINLLPCGLCGHPPGGICYNRARCPGWTSWCGGQSWWRSW